MQQFPQSCQEFRRGSNQTRVRIHLLKAKRVTHLAHRPAFGRALKLLRAVNARPFPHVMSRIVKLPRAWGMAHFASFPGVHGGNLRPSSRAQVS